MQRKTLHGVCVRCAGLRFNGDENNKNGLFARVTSRTVHDISIVTMPNCARFISGPSWCDSGFDHGTFSQHIGHMWKLLRS